MTLGISSFTFSFTSSFNVEKAHSFMNNLKNAILASSANWELDSDVHGINNITETSYVKTTFSVHNTSTGEYVRFWVGNNYTFTFPETDTANTVNNSFFISRKNIEILGGDTKSYPDLSFLFCGVSDSSINDDPGFELSLKTPIFSFDYERIGYSSYSSNFRVPDPSYSYKYVITSDGQGFTILSHAVTSGELNNAIGMMYHPNLLLTRTGDTYISGSLILGNNSSFTFNAGRINSIYALYYNSLGSSNYVHNKNVFYLSALCQTSSTATTIPCVPVACYTYPPTYEGSDSVLVKDYVGFKGYTNMSVIRTTYPGLVNIGVSYANSTWLCVGEGILIPWLQGHDADSPFVS